MRRSETLAQALGQPFTAENEANIEEVRVKKTEKVLYGTLSQAVPEPNLSLVLSVK